LQLDQLRHAERSPAEGALEQDQGPPAASRAVEVDDIASLVGEHDIRESLARLRPD
jgi:hypothetical protein